MAEYYCIYRNGQLMETKIKDNWSEDEIKEYAFHRYGDCFIQGL